MCVLVFNDTSALVDYFVPSPRERDKRDSRGDEREGQGRRRNGNKSEEKEEIKNIPLYSYLLQGLQALPNCKPVLVISWTPHWRKIHNTFASPDHPQDNQINSHLLLYSLEVPYKGSTGTMAQW